MNRIDLSIIIVSWKVCEKLRDNLQAIFSSLGEIDFKVYVVDNNSLDGTIEMVASEFPWVTLIANQDNLGFAKANNQALRLCSEQSDFVLLLNPDMKVGPNTLIDMLSWMRSNELAAVAGCRLISESGEIVKHVRRFPTLYDQMAIALKLPHIFPSILQSYLREDFDYSQPARVDSVRGGFFMLRGKAIEKIGLLDERYFVWFEEVDYCRRAYEAGLQVWYSPAAECIDYVGQSFKQVKRGATQKYFQDSMLKYFKKWHPFWQYVLLKMSWPFGRMIAVVADKANIKSNTKT